MMRTDRCGDLRAGAVGEEVVVCGWVHSRRDHGGVTFIDLRDTSGLIQIVFSTDIDDDTHALAQDLRSEWVVRVTGSVRARREGTTNPQLPTGEIEIAARRLEILSRAETPPFQIDEHQEVDELLRLKYRYLDLRRERMQENLQLRHRIVGAIRRFFDAEGFVEIETPMLTASTPEGARDYLVPSRVHPGAFFALPQSPQIYKQLLVISGFERYFQIARCFRDEDLRADRQPEFTQIDVEASFIEQDDIIAVTEGLVQALFAEAGRPVEYDLICEPAPDEGGSSLELDWRGQSETLEEAQGDLDANHPELRRVDLAVDVLESATVLAGQSTAVTLPATTTRWAVKVDFVTSGGEGVYASGGYAHLKNRDTGQVVRGAWIAGGGGAGVELPIPAVSPNPSWSNFETSSPVSFASFDGTAVRFTHVDVGIGIAGYSFAYLSFPFFMDEGVSVSGFVMNQWGLGGSVTSGVWSFEEPIPPPPTFAVEEAIPVETTVGTSFGHRVLFETGEEIVSDDELERLRAFVSALP